MATGIEDHELQMSDRLQQGCNPVKRDRLVFDVAFARKLGIHRDQPVAPVYLDAVTGVVHDSDVSGAGRVLEFAQRSFELEIGKVIATVENLEPGLLQERRNGGCIVDWIWQISGVLICGIADDERDAAFVWRGVSRKGKQQGTPAGSDYGKNPDHPVLLPCRDGPLKCRTISYSLPVGYRGRLARNFRKM